MTGLIVVAAIIAAIAFGPEWCNEHIPNSALPKRFVEFFDLQE